MTSKNFHMHCPMQFSINNFAFTHIASEVLSILGVKY